VKQLQIASQPKPIDPALPLELARARKQVEAAFAAGHANELWWNDLSDANLVQAGVNAVLKWLKPS
jgi:hypothetical protein